MWKEKRPRNLHHFVEKGTNGSMSAKTIVQGEEALIEPVQQEEIQGSLSIGSTTTTTERVQQTREYNYLKAYK